MVISGAAREDREDKEERRRAFQRPDFSDSEPEEAFDRHTQVAAGLFRAPIALLGLADRDRFWVKSRFSRDLADLPREAAPWHQLIGADRVLVIPDMRADSRFSETPAARHHGMRFCAGTPLITRGGDRIGVLCVMDVVPRSDVGEQDGANLMQVAGMLVDEIERRQAARQFTGEHALRTLAEMRLRLLGDIAEAALAAPDFKRAIAACLRLIAERIGADCAFAYGLAPNAARCELEAEYIAPGLGSEEYLDFIRRFPVRADNSIVGESVLHQRLVAVADLSAIEPQLFPVGGATIENGFCSLLGVPFENAGSKFGLTFLFRRTRHDMSEVAETVHGLSGKLRDLLARKQAEERIALLQSVVLHANDAVMITEAPAPPGDGARIIYINRAFSVMTGYPADEVLGRTPYFLHGPATDPTAADQLRAALSRWEPLRVEMINYRKDGGEFWAEMDVTPVADANGWYTHWIAVLRDTTARKNAENRLRERELTLRRLAQRQAAILDALPAHVALLDREGRILSVSRSWNEFAAASGIDATMPVGHSYFEFCDARCWGELSQGIADGLNAVLSGRQAQFSVDHPSDHGAWRRWYRLMAAPLTTGDSAGAVVMHLDVTSNKLAEEALRREKEFSEFLIKSSTEGIVVFDREFRITLWNPGIEHITGMAADKVLARRILDVLPYLAETLGEAAMRGALEGRETKLSDQHYDLAETGREGYYEAYFSPLYSRGREIIGGIGFLRETTERRRIEDALRQSQKMEAVGQLTGGIAHDFNNMLTVIAGNLELLEGKLADEPRLLRLVASATLAASRAEKLTQQLLTFSRRQQLRPQPIDFNQIVIGMDDLLFRTVGEHLEIRKQLAPDLWPALADPNQIETALLNLILNARDAMPQGGHITIETSNAEIVAGDGELTPGTYATLSVADTGQGMSEEVLAHVFEPFFTTKEVGKGTGLGLAQVYGFIEQSSGHVQIESRVGVGTTVRLFLPRAAGAVGLSDATPMREEQYRGNERVLVVEDDQGVRDFAVSVLRELGYQVLEASNGDAALELLRSTPDIDLLFTDVVMPGELGGADLAKAAREQRPGLTVLFTSGYTTRLADREWEAGIVDFLRKPYRSIDLAARVRAVLNRAGPPAP
ncbi:MAG TPA: PAS domain S-box protein [Stellaceae bacterium]|nr:PAS domain S-box protein [Stellaceae bacterium]